MTTTAHRPTVTARVPKGSHDHALHRASEARRADDALVAAAACPEVLHRADAVADARRANRAMIGARSHAAYLRAVLNWERLPHEPALRAEVRTVLDAVVAACEARRDAATACAELLPADQYPETHAAWVDTALAAHRERMVWADLRARTTLAGR